MNGGTKSACVAPTQSASRRRFRVPVPLSAKTGSGDPNLVMIKDDVARRGGRQLKEYMLCDRCEAWIERWEGYLSRITIQEDDTFPALAQVKPLPEESSPGLLVTDA